MLIIRVLNFSLIWYIFYYIMLTVYMLIANSKECPLSFLLKYETASKSILRLTSLKLWMYRADGIWRGNIIRRRGEI